MSQGVAIELEDARFKSDLVLSWASGPNLDTRLPVVIRPKIDKKQ